MTLWHGKTAELDTSIYAPALGALLDATMARVAARRLGAVTEADVLASVMSQRWDAPEFLALAAEDRAEFRDTAALVAARAAEGVRPADCLAAFDLVGEQVSREINPFERGAWRAPMPALIEALDDGATIPALLAALFAAASELPDGDLLTSLFDAPSLIDALRVASAKASAFEAGILDQAAVTPRALFAIERALALAAKAGRDKASGVDLLAAMISHKDTYAQLVLRRAGVAANTTAVSNWLGTMIDSPALPAAVPLEPGVESFAPDLADMLQAAVSSAAATGVPAAGERELLRGLLASTDPQVVYTIDNALSLPRPLLSDLLRQVPEPEVIEPYLPRDICPVRDLTGGSSEPVGRDSLTAAIVKVMFRKKTRNVLLHGERGVGASTMAQVLAAALRSGRFAALRHTHVIQFDLAGLPAGDYETAVDKVFAFMDAEPERIYVLEGFAPYFEENFERCARRLTHNEYRLILVVNTAEHTALTQGSQVLTDFLEVIEVPEPSAELTTQIVEAAATRVAGEYGVAFGPVAVATARAAAALGCAVLLCDAVSFMTALPLSLPGPCGGPSCGLCRHFPWRPASFVCVDPTAPGIRHWD
ncbi:MAG: hypothetical protein LBJ08_02865, partial [Bifidobacteriaceae bacterium]|nr:hypothetical protein [Bifidobacteriaceae bacterium]